MATSLTFTAAARGRVVHRLVPAPSTTPAPAPVPLSPAIVIGPARSAFWQNRIESLAIERAELTELVAIKDGVGALNQSLGSSCATRSDMSDQAFTVIARLTTIAAALMDRQNVTLDSVLDKLTDPSLSVLVAEVHALLPGAAFDHALDLLDRAVDPAPFSLWAQQRVPQTDLRIYDELNRRAALLLAAKCEVATTATDIASDWPPIGVVPPAPTPTTPPAPAPSTPGVTGAAPARKGGARRGRA